MDGIPVRSEPGGWLNSLWQRKWLLLLLGGILLAVSNGRWIIPLGAWLAPVLLMGFFRQMKRFWLAILLLWLTVFITLPIAWFGLWPFPPQVMAQIVAMGAGWAVIPYILDRITHHRFPGFLQTLVFPSTVVAIEFVNSSGSGSTWGNLAYTQTENLPLLQFAAVAGIWGISFLMLWLAPVVNNLWLVNRAGQPQRMPLLVYASVLIMVLLAGSARLTLFPADGEAMRVAMIVPPDPVDLNTEEGLRFYQDFQLIFSKQNLDPKKIATAREAFGGLVDPLFSDIRRQARAGARLIVTTEASLITFGEEDDQRVIERARQLAREESIYLGLGIAMVPLSQEGKNENRLILIDPNGEVVKTYWKHQTIPVVEEPFAVSGSKTVLTHQSQQTTFGGVICYDLDSPQYMQNAGTQKVDILMTPTGDWPAIKGIHARMAIMRAVEQGFSLVRPAAHGVSLATDYHGRIHGRMDHYSTDERQLSAWVPKAGVTTIYTRTGDIFSWTCVAFSGLSLGYILLSVLGSILGFRKRSGPEIQTG